MRHDAMITYLHDHLTGARGALELLQYLGDHAGDIALRLEAPDLVRQIEEERALLEGLATELGGSGTSVMKEASAWMGEKLSRLKLGRIAGRVDGLPLFEAVEALVLGIQGKIALWDALTTVSAEDPTFPRRDFATLRDHAREQVGRMERHRLRLAKQVLIPAA